MLNKELFKEIYEYAQSEKLQSFHAVGFGILPTTTLMECLERKIEPEHFIIVNSLIQSYMVDKKTLEKRFGLPVVVEHHDPSLFVDLT